MPSIQVAVRLRCWLPNDEDKSTRKLGVDMQGQEVIIINPENEATKKFAFNYAYWSHDKSQGHNFVKNLDIYNDIGNKILEKVLDGENYTLFAYGQTGSGKSYSMTGDSNNVPSVDPGIIQLVCRGIFEMIKKETAKDGNQKVFAVESTMMEIYCDQIKDLLNPKAGRLESHLNPHSKAKGFWVPGLQPHAVKDAAGIIDLMELGFKNRSLTATKMNKTSSRAHTIFAIKLTQKFPNEAVPGKWKKLEGTITLVDLAGSECLKNTGATGIAAKEGTAINLSLTSLGLVIDGLSKKAKYDVDADAKIEKKGLKGKEAKAVRRRAKKLQDKVKLPFRNSELTKLLKEALAGNSNTTMIAAIRPNIRYFENTKKTLQFAKRASAVKTKAVKNESPTDALIRGLKTKNKKLEAELEKLKSMVSGDYSDPDKDNEIERLKKELENSKKAVAQEEKSDQDKEAEAAKMKQELEKYLKENGASGNNEERKTKAHLINLNEDPMMSGVLFYVLEEGKTTIGEAADNNFRIEGMGVSDLHCVVNVKGSGEDTKVNVEPCSDSRTYVNGKLISEGIELHNGDRMIMGQNHFYKLIIPAIAAKQTENKQLVGFFEAQEELIKAQGTAPKVIDEEELKKIKEKEEEFEKEKLKLQEQLASLSKNAYDYEDKTKQLEEQLKNAQNQAAEFKVQKEKEAAQKNLLEHKIMKSMPLINEVNEMAKYMEKTVEYHIKLLSTGSYGDLSQAEIHVEVTDKRQGLKSIWTFDKLEAVSFGMRDAYNEKRECERNDETYKPKKKSDPFAVFDPTEAQELGQGIGFLKSLSHGIEYDKWIDIRDYKGKNTGEVSISFQMCDENGVESEDVDYFQENPEDLVDTTMCFNLHINQVRLTKTNFNTNVYIAYKFFDEDITDTNRSGVTSDNPQIGFKNFYKFSPVTDSLVNYLMRSNLVFKVYGFAKGYGTAKEVEYSDDDDDEDEDEAFDDDNNNATSSTNKDLNELQSNYDDVKQHEQALEAKIYQLTKEIDSQKQIVTTLQQSSGGDTANLVKAIQEKDSEILLVQRRGDSEIKRLKAKIVDQEGVITNLRKTSGGGSSSNTGQYEAQIKGLEQQIADLKAQKSKSCVIM